MVYDLKLETVSGFAIKNTKGEIISKGDRPKKIWSLFKLLLLHYHQSLHYEYIYETIINQPSQDIKHLVRNLVYRLRITLKKMNIYNEEMLNIDYRNDAYMLVIGSKVSFDLNDLIAFDFDSCQNLDEFIQVFSGEILPEERFSEWLFPIRIRYRNIFIQSIKEICHTLSKGCEYEKIIRILELLDDLCMEEEYLAMLRLTSYLELGYRSDAIQYYYRVEDYLFNEYGIDPSEELQAIIHKINDTSIEANGDLIALNGAFTCSISEFRKIYQLEKRKRLRGDEPLLYLDLSVQASKQAHQVNVMDQLRGVLINSLRQCDVFSEEKEGHYHIMLNNTKKSQVHQIEARIVNEVVRTLGAEMFEYSFNIIDESINS